MSKKKVAVATAVCVASVAAARAVEFVAENWMPMTGKEFPLSKKRIGKFLEGPAYPASRGSFDGL